MARTVLLFGVALVAVWLVLTVTKAVVGTALWLVLAAGIALIVVSAAKHFTAGKTHDRLPG